MQQLTEWYLMAWKQYFTLSGRSRRKEYFYFILGNVLIGILLGILDTMTGTYDSEAGMGILGGIYAIAAFIPSITLTVRRLHDTDRAGWWLFIAIIPIVGFLVLLYFMLTDSDEDENQYGLSPKAA